MAVVLRSEKFGNILIESNKIIGIMGDYEHCFNSLTGKKIFCVNKECDFHHTTVKEEISYYYSQGYAKESINSIIKIMFNELSLKKEYLDKDIKSLSHSERRLLQYLLMFVFNPRIVLIDEVYLDLDSFYKRKIRYLLRRIMYKTNKIILIGSHNSNDIYDICDTIILIGEDEYLCGKANDLLADNSILQKYQIDMPDLVQFVNLVHEKGKMIAYTNDVRDLIKEVYRNV